MDRLYREVSEEFLAGLRKYIEGEIGYCEAARLSGRESLAFRSQEWGAIIEAGSGEALGMKRRMYDEILRIEECVKTMERMEEGRGFDVDLEGVVSHSEIAGRSRSHPAGYEGTGLYLPPFPSQAMVGALNSGDSESSSGE